jgi:hypothetical protein
MYNVLKIYIFLTLCINIFCIPPTFSQSIKKEKAADIDQFEIVGIIKNPKGHPVVGEIVYFAPITGGNRIETTFLLKDGATSGIKNPNSQTDKNGRFVIAVHSSLIEKGKEFTIGILNCPECFVTPNRQLMRDRKPLKFLIDPESTKSGKGKPQINLGQIILE